MSPGCVRQQRGCLPWLAREPLIPDNDPDKAVLGEIIAEKHGKMGLKLK